MTDARFEDSHEAPMRLMATSADDLSVLSSLVQDAVFPISEMNWSAKRREFSILMNRFRWEDKPAAEVGKRGYERVQSVLMVRDALSVSSQGIDRAETDTVISVLSIAFIEGEDGAGEVLLTLAGDGAIRCRVECLNLTLTDVTRPYLAPSGKVPHHPE